MKKNAKDIPSVNIEELTWLEYVERIEKGAAVIIPCGSLEQHGPHLPLHTDEFIPRSIAEDVAKVTGAIVAPSIFYGAKSQALVGGGQVFPGTTSLNGQTLIYVVRDIVSELLRHGAKKIMLLNGHGENRYFLYEGVDLALSAQGSTGAKVILIMWWEHVSEETLERVFPEGFPGWALEHAGVIETSLLYVLAPELVKAERIKDEELEFVPKYTVFPQPANLVPKSGMLREASSADPESGRLVLEEIQEGILEVMRREFL